MHRKLCVFSCQLKMQVLRKEVRAFKNYYCNTFTFSPSKLNTTAFVTVFV